MPTTTFDPSTNEVSVEQKTAEAAALEKGQELADANAEDKLRQFEKTESENELIGGKFRTQEDLLKAYQELQTKLGSNEKTEEGEEATAEADEAPKDEAPEEEEPVNETVDYMFELSKQFEETVFEISLIIEARATVGEEVGIILELEYFRIDLFTPRK